MKKLYIRSSDNKITSLSLLKVSVNNITLNICFSGKNSKLKYVIFDIGFNVFT